MSKGKFWTPRILREGQALGGRFTAAQVSSRLKARYKRPPTPMEVGCLLDKLARRQEVRKAGFILDHSRDLTAKAQVYELTEGGEVNG